MAGVIELDEAFRRMVFDAGFREDLRAGRWDGDAEVARALLAVDARELARLTGAVRRGVASGRLGGASVVATFEGTLRELRAGGASEDDVLDAFLASPHVLDVEAVGNGVGVSVVEAFHAFAAATLPTAAGRRVAQHEFCTALLRMLAVTPQPFFEVRSPLLRRHPSGMLAVLDAAHELRDADDRPAEPVVLVASRGRYWSGAVGGATAAALLTVAARTPPWALEVREREPATVAAVLARLHERELL